ncbi:Gfo/Idh/MocA family oxidoreductase [Puniceicoccaceae bacterium K14]|nr:Gfo/Idh/MocA family oxidoreductase [Puniceicoccaceae bacterium K14]
MAQTVKAGLIGCGDIFQAYFNSSLKLDLFEIKSCASLGGASAKKKAAENAILAVSVDELLADPEIEIVINLTTPLAHTEINLKALAAGKNVYCEKPFAVTRDEAKKVLKLANEKGLRVGSAPDTFLGGGLQTCRKAIDDGLIGRPVAGTAIMMCHGHEHWHPNPGFYYLEGGGPLFDMGPYYLTALVHLLGPIKSVTAMCGRSFDDRIASSKRGEERVFPVEVDTHTAGILEFCNGAIVTVVMSFDVWRHSNQPIEIHGTKGSMKVPDPNMFNGEILLSKAGGAEWGSMPYTHGYTENMRGVGAADMAHSLQVGQGHRCSSDMAYHIIDVMHAFGESSELGRHISIESGCERPQALPTGLNEGQLA